MMIQLKRRNSVNYKYL